MSGEDLLAAGETALKDGKWGAAKEAFGAALAIEESAEALFGFGAALWWLGDMRGTIEYIERAYGAFVRRPDPTYAAACALRLSFHYQQHLGNDAAASGWFARGARLVEEHDVAPLKGEVLLMAAYLAPDPRAGEVPAREALALGRSIGDRDLELCALAQLGAVLAAQGKVEEGVALLDEAMAGCAGGEPNSRDTVVFTHCLTMTTCTRCAQFERAVRWVQVAERYADQIDFPFFYVECRALYGSVLFGMGEWQRAEDVARGAIELSNGAVPASEVYARATIAQRRLAEGLLDEAERVLSGFELFAPAVPVVCRIHLARGKPALAAATARRRLDLVSPNPIESVLLEEVLGEAEIADGHHGQAADRGRALVALGESLDCKLIVARGNRLLGRALGGAELEERRRRFDRAIDAFFALSMPYEVAQTRYALAEALGATEPELAAIEGRSAFDAFEKLGANRDADACAALLRSLGVKTARTGPRQLETLSQREREVLVLLGEALSNPEIAKRLFVSRKTIEHHVARILSKLGLKSRAEAALVARGLEQKSATK